MKPFYVIRENTKLTDRNGAEYVLANYFKQTVWNGESTYFCRNPLEAKRFATRALAKLNIKNRFPHGKGLSVEKIYASAQRLS